MIYKYNAYNININEEVYYSLLHLLKLLYMYKLETCLD